MPTSRSCLIAILLLPSASAAFGPFEGVNASVSVGATSFADERMDDLGLSRDPTAARVVIGSGVLGTWLQAGVGKYLIEDRDPLAVVNILSGDFITETEIDAWTFWLEAQRDLYPSQLGFEFASERLNRVAKDVHLGLGFGHEFVSAKRVAPGCSDGEFVDCPSRKTGLEGGSYMSGQVGIPLFVSRHGRETAELKLNLTYTHYLSGRDAKSVAEVGLAARAHKRN